MIILKDQLMCLAKISGTKGIKGHLKIKSLDNLEALKGKEVIIENNFRLSNILVESIDSNTIKFKNYDNINDSKNLVNSSIYIFKRDIEIFPNILRAELIGKDIYFNNNIIGVIKNFLDLKSYILLNIKLENRVIDVPFISEFTKVLNRKIYIIDLNICQ
jgi:ribosomal 30S subunit maturation factor RimM